MKTDRPTCCAGHHAAPAKRAPPVGPPDLPFAFRPDLFGTARAKEATLLT